MKFHHWLSVPLLFSLLSIGCAHLPPTLSTQDKQQLLENSYLELSDSHLVYEGEVFPVNGSSDTSVYKYQRVVKEQGDSIQATHTTYRLNHEPVLVQTVTHRKDYGFIRFQSIDNLSGISGSAEQLDNGSLKFVVNKNGKTKTVVEKTDLPVVAGPTLFGFILTNWNSLITGKTIRFAFLLLERAQTINFTVRYDGKDSFVVEAESSLMKFFVDPMRVVFNLKERNPIRYIGRVPPLLEINGKLKPFDARVEYRYASNTYR